MLVQEKNGPMMILRQKKNEKKEAEGSSSKTNDSSDPVIYAGPISYPLLNAPKKSKKRK